MATYIAILSKKKRTDYGVDFPDLPGCVTAGSTLEEARKNAEEALSLHLEGLVEEGLPVPPPSSLDRIVRNPENADGVPFIVTVPDPEPRAVRVNITLPADVLERVDAYVEKLGTTRSAFLAEAAVERIRTSPKKRRSGTLLRS